jgi:single-stranded DNA-binding protein
MAQFNQINMCGTVTRPLFSETEGGSPQVNFTLNVTTGHDDKEYHSRFTVVMYGQTAAETAAQIKENDLVMLTGKLTNVRPAVTPDGFVYGNMTVVGNRLIRVMPDEKQFAEIAIVGHLGRQPTLEYTADGTESSFVSLAHEKRRKATNADGTKNEKRPEDTLWCSVFFKGQTAWNASNWLKTGQSIVVRGSVHSKGDFNPNTGEPQAKLMINAWGFDFNGAGKKDENEGAETSAPARRTANPAALQAAQSNVMSSLNW